MSSGTWRGARRCGEAVGAGCSVAGSAVCGSAPAYLYAFTGIGIFWSLSNISGHPWWVFLAVGIAAFLACRFTMHRSNSYAYHCLSMCTAALQYIYQWKCIAHLRSQPFLFTECTNH